MVLALLTLAVTVRVMKQKKAKKALKSQLK
jgi:hypothetical protein